LGVALLYIYVNIYSYIAGVKMQINLHHKLHQNAVKKKEKKKRINGRKMEKTNIFTP